MNILIEKLKLLRDDLQFDLDNYRDPATYQESEYYIKCSAKADAIEQVISEIDRLIKEEENEAVCSEG